MSQAVRWRAYSLAGLFLIAAVTAIAAVTRLWVLTAIPIGFLFGFFLQKGDLCGSSAFSEVVIARDWRKVLGLWVAIVVSMLGFALLDVLGLVSLNVKPMLWLSMIVGGLLFGCGMVLAGGCVSGCLFKAAAGNLNSIAALIAIPVGIALVEHGPLKGFNASLRSSVIKTADGSALSLPAVTGLPYWTLAVLFAAVTVAVMAWRRRPSPEAPPPETGSRLERTLTRPWKPWQAGIAIGLLGMLAYLSSSASGRNYPLGVTHGVLHAQILLTDADVNHVYQKASAKPAPAAAAAPATRPPKKVVWWLVLLVGSLMLGSFFSARLSGQARLLPKPPEQTVVALLGGFLVGAGAAIAGGCVIGNILSGWALMSLGTVLFGVVTLLANWATTYLYLMGGARATG